MTRYFNKAGPCQPDIHFLLPPAGRLPEVHRLVERRSYFVIHAPRQSGKTTALLALAAELTAEGQYAAAVVTVEEGAPFGSDPGAAEAAVLGNFRRDLEAQLPPELLPPPWPATAPGDRIGAALAAWARACPRPIVLFVDEIDALQDDTLLSVLRQLRAGFPKRPRAFPSSIALVGLRDVRDYEIASGGSPRLGTPSPFNILDTSLTLRAFTRDEVAALYAQHTDETGQAFEEATIDRAFDLTRGQPWLVNALAGTAVDDIVPDRAIAVTAAHFDHAKERLVLSRATHLDSLADKLGEERVRRVLQPVLAGREVGVEVPRDDVDYVTDLGLIARDAAGNLAIANPIYREVIPREIASVTADVMVLPACSAAGSIRSSAICAKRSGGTRGEAARGQSSCYGRAEPGSRAEAMVTLHARNFRVLRHLVWPLREVSVLTGANGAGKTTALLALRTLRVAFDRGLPEAVSSALGGSFNLRSHEADEGEPIELGLAVGDLSWHVRLTPRAATVGYLTDEQLTRGSETIFLRDSLGNFFYRGQRQDLAAPAVERLGLRLAAETHPDDQDVAKMTALVSSIQVFYDPDIRGLREGGSRATDDRVVQAHGRNVFTMLRTWRDRRADVPRFNFVHEGLQAAFPGVYEGLEFEGSQTITARVFRPGDETPNPISHEANGLIAMMLLLAQVASAPAGGLMAIDEPEHSLHPYAIRRFVRLSRAWAEKHDITIVLTTHSPVLLDEFNGAPDRIFVLERGHTTLPVRLDDLRDRAWLASYTLGELYTGGEFAANEKT